jgi:hypothetical protein
LSFSISDPKYKDKEEDSEERKKPNRDIINTKDRSSKKVFKLSYSKKFDKRFDIKVTI